VPQWRIPIELHRRYPSIPILCDPSHIGGKRELIGALSQQAMDMNFDGLVIESHCNPDCALSDSAQQITPESLNLIINTLVLRSETSSTENLTLLRQQIDRIDDELLELLSRRMSVAREIGHYKLEHHMPAVQAGRYNALMERRVKDAESLELGTDFMRTVLEAIHEESVRQQIEILEK
jgi:chorismate mutase